MPPNVEDALFGDATRLSCFGIDGIDDEGRFVILRRR